MEAKNLLAIAKKWLWLFILAGILGGSAGLGFGLLQPKQYQADAVLFISTPSRSDYFSILGDQQAAKAFAAFPKSVVVITTTMKSLDIKDLDLNKFAKQLTVENIRETQFVNIKVRDSSPERAAALANELARQTVLLSEKSDTTIGPDKKFLQDNLVALETQIQKKQQELTTLSTNPEGNADKISKITKELVDLRGSYSTVLNSFNQFNSAKATFWQRAEIPESPVGSGPSMLIIIGLMVGVLLAVGIVAFIEQTDDILRTPAKVTEASGLPTFITVKRLPTPTRMLALAAPGGSTPEAHHDQEFVLPEVFLKLGAFFQSNEALSPNGEQLGVLLVTSPEDGDGKTLNASQIAIGLARLGNSVVLLDANLRSPGIHTLFGAPNVTGLGDFLAAPEKYELDELLLPTHEANLHIMTAGSALGIGTELLSSQNMVELLKTLREKSLVIMDSPSVLNASEPLILANRSDGVLIVVDARYTQAVKLNQTLQVLNRVNPNILGVVLNRASTDE